MTINGERIFCSEIAKDEWPYAFSVTHADDGTEAKAMVQLPSDKQPADIYVFGFPRGRGGHVLVVGDEYLQDIRIKSGVSITLGQNDRHGITLVEYRLTGT